MKKKLFIYFTVLGLISQSCTEQSEKNATDTDRKVVIRSSNDAATLNPVSARDELSMVLSNQIYQPLLAVDFKTNKLVGVLAKTIPHPVVNAEGKLSFSYTLREEAKFDNGRSITAEDVLFSIKLNICPLVNNVGGAYYYDFIEEFVIDSNNPKKFTIICSTPSISNQYSSGDYAILPKEVYDSLDVLSKYTLKQLLNSDSLKDDPTIQKFAQQFNALANQSESIYFEGSGAYDLERWDKDARIVLTRKQDWWGNKYAGENTFFTINANTLQYEIINDNVTATMALKSGQIDFMKSIPANEIENIEKNDNLKLEFVDRIGYQYLGFNTQKAPLNDKLVRKAIEAAIPYQEIIRTVFKNQANINRLPLALQLKNLRNSSIKPQETDLELAGKLLDEAGWKDSNKDGIRDKDGAELIISYHYNAENTERESIGLVLKNELKKVGIVLEVKGIEWTNYLKFLQSNEAMLFINGTSSSPLNPDFQSSLHSSSANGGRNYANYQNSELDKLIDSIDLELNDQKRKSIIYRIQEMVIDDVPYVYLVTKKESVAYSKKLKKVSIYSQRPHYWAPELY